MTMLARDFHSKSRRQGHTTWQELRSVGQQMAKEMDLDFIGNGQECVVVSYKGEERFVTAFAYRDISPEKAKGVFHAQRILSTIFPHNFPRFKASFHSTETTSGGTVREKVIEEVKTPKFPFTEKIQKTLEANGINVWFDTAQINFLTGVDGGEYYVDITHLSHWGWDKEKALKYMDNNLRQDGVPFTKSDKQIVESSLDQLKTLGVFEGKHDF